MDVVGVDLSLSSTGVASSTSCGHIITELRGVQRLAFVGGRVLAICDNADLVVIENYAFSRHDSYAHALGELGGVVRLALHRAGITYTEVSPTCLKRYALGKGGGKNTTKTDVRLAAFKYGGIEFDNDDECDAWWLRQMGLAALVPTHADVVTVPTAHRAALEAVTWPELVA